jgi:hypothetical protein
MCQAESNTKEEEKIEEQEELEEAEEIEEENICIRAKWTIDDAKTIDEAIEKLNDFIEYLKYLKEQGWEFREPVNDDYGFLYKN